MALHLSADAPASVAPQKYLFGPFIDFFMLGGSALLILPVLYFVPLRYEAALALTTLLLSHFINQPHFGHSYQIFYRNFARKVRGDGYSRNLQIRYIIAGIVVPLVMTAFFAYGSLAGNARLLGNATNAMGFFVGWHYVKQGYGMLMVDAVLKRKFFSEHDKKVLLFNGYAVWLFAWLQTNVVIAERQFWGLQYYTFAVPPWLITIAMSIAAASSAATAVMFINRWRKHGGALPYNGVVAYVVSLYAWILFVTLNPLWLLVVPAMHSLQYLAVVWRYQTNVERDRVDAVEKPELKILSIFGALYRLRVTTFIIVGGILGALGFWLVPIMLIDLVPYDKAVLGSSLFLFIAWIFINVHHYFLDNVMWRRGNPEVSKYLFR
ncbi:hypothetical protein [Mesorhizobium erdmanii]|uniref:hypothetical protein n=1 Tax=Mesorhizobium erdmanii TaxID=1777866 RepID=UPI000428F38D|nr:hypothetical protein [Mesorhizobium erdmanii]